MDKQNKGLDNIKIKRDSLQATLKEIDANYWGLKAKKDTLNIKHNKLQRDYKNMEENLLEQRKEVDELKMDNANAYQIKNEIQRQVDQRHAHMDKNLQKQMAFNEKLNKLLKDTQKKKPSIMILFLEKIGNSISKIFCFR
jgi:chromosome segregation ATPase